MSRGNRNVNVGITSSFDGRGFKSAEQSAGAMERELMRLEQSQRRQYQMVSQAEREMSAELRAQAEVRERINERQRSAMESAGKLVLGISAAAATGLALTGKAAMDWESQWAGVTKTVDGTSAQLDTLEGDLRRMARSLPASHGEIAAVAEAAGQLGVATPDVAKFSETMIHLGETTNMSADEAATALAQLSNIMGTSTDDVGRLGSTVVALGNNSATTERSIVLMGQRIAGSAAIIGMTEADTLALAAALASVGIEVEAGGTAISRVMTDIAKSVDAGGEDLQAFANIAGVSAEDFARAFREDPAEAIVTFIEGLGRIDEAGGSVFQTLDDLGMSDVRVSRALLGMANSGDLLRESIELGNAAWEENTALLEEAEQRYQTTESKLQIARNQINDAAIDIGGNFLPVLAEAVDGVGSLATWFGSLPDGAQQWISWLGAGAAGVGLLGGAALIAVPKLHEFRLAVDSLNGGTSRVGRMAGGMASVLTGPWGLAIAGGITALGFFAKAQGDAVREAEELRGTLDEQTGAITENTAAWAARKAQDEGILDTAELIGASAADVTDAMLGNAEAAERVREAIDGVTRTTDEFGVATYTTADGTRVYYTDLLKLQELIDETSDATAEQAERQRQLNGATEDSEAATTGAADAQGELAGAIGDTTDEADALQEALDALAEALRDLNNPTLDLIDAEIAWESTLRSVNDQLEENGRQLDITTEKGAANQEFLNRMARDAMSLAEAILQETDSEVQFRASLEESRQALAATAEQFGMSEEEAWEYVNSVLAIPAAAVTQVEADTGNAVHSLNEYLVELNAAEGTVTINGDEANAEQTLGDLVGDIDESDGTVTINGNKYPADQTLGEYLADVMESYAETNVGADMSAANRTVGVWVPDEKTGSVKYVPWMEYFDPPNYRRQVLYETRIARGQALPPEYDRPMADGGVLEFYAGGGIRENHVAQIAPAGAWRVWAEPETGGEAYIPLAPGKRERSEEILGEVAHRFGMYVGRYADGAVVGGPSAGGTASATAAPSVHVTIGDIHNPVSETAGETIARTLASIPAVELEGTT